MLKFVWGNIAGKFYTIGTCLILGTLVVCIPCSTNGLSFLQNIFIGCFAFGFWLLLGGILVTIYNVAGGSEKPEWVGIGMTPFAGSARRNREVRLIQSSDSRR